MLPITVKDRDCAMIEYNRKSSLFVKMSAKIESYFQHLIVATHSYL